MMNNKFGLAIGFVVVIGLLTLSSFVSAEKEIPLTKFGQNVGAPTMTFLYW